MILNIIMFKNEKIGAFTTPQFIDVEPEKAAIQLARSMRIAPDKATPYQNLTMWFMGTFDDESGEINTDDGLDMILDCRKVWNQLKIELQEKAQEGEKDELLCKTREHEENA